MSIRDIIESLREFAYDNRPRHWKVLQAKCSVAIQQLDELAKEVALMEAVCEAAADYLQDTCNECGFRTCEMPDSEIGCSLDDICNTRAALIAYRKERGL